MKFLFLIIFFLFTLGGTQSLAASPCDLTASEKEQLIALPYEAFDQQPNGWRLYAEKGCYEDMGKLIDEYLLRNAAKLLDWQVQGITWHGGQMYAFHNDYQTAKERFNQSLHPKEPPNSPILWNAYVKATIAFLDKDKPSLLRYREEIANGPVLGDGHPANLDIVDNLIRYFDERYSFAYHPPQFGLSQ